MKVRRYRLPLEQETDSKTEFYNRENVRLVVEIRKKLQLDGYHRKEDIRKDLKEYRNLLQNQFTNDRRRNKMDLRKFLDTEDGKNWEAPGSMLLLLFGRNEIGISTMGHSWLSPVAVELAETVFDFEHAVAYVGCIPSSTLQEGISHLIF